MKGKCNSWKFANHVGLFFVVLFVVCFAWSFINPAQHELHVQLFEVSYLWFDGMNLASFVSGAIQTYIWGYVVVGAWLLSGGCHKGEKCCK